MLRSSNALGSAQNTNVQNDDVHCSRSLSGYYRHDKGNLMTIFQPRTNEQKNNIVLPFSPVGKSKSCCFICKNKNTGLVMVPQNHAWHFLQHNILVPMGVFCCKQHLFNYLNSHIFKAAVVAQSVRAFAPQGEDKVFESQPRQT